jgi:PAS domain S-box-containing protein
VEIFLVLADPSSLNRLPAAACPILKTRPHTAASAKASHRRVEVRHKGKPKQLTSPQTKTEIERLFHELQVHQLELQMQNAEIQEARDKADSLLETYTDLYDFAPIGYFSIDEQGTILEVNLTGAALLGIERPELINRRLQGFVAPMSRTTFLAFFKKIFTGPGKQICETSLLNKRGVPFWADLQAASAGSLRGKRKWCRVAISDLTTLKQAEEVRLRLEALAVVNEELRLEIVQRRKVEEALKKSEAHYAQLFKQSRHMQEQLRHLSRQLLLTQEEERKRISRELHDEIVQTLVGINVHLASLTVVASVNLKDLRRKIALTQRLVEKSVTIVHRFARELRPTVLDDLGLVPALQSYIKDFTKRTKIHIHFTAFDGVEQLNSTQRTVLYRVAQSALANVDKHAQATNVKVSIRKLQRAICLEIHDDGKSFEMARVMFAKRHKRLGLLGSRERVEMVGGKFGVESAQGKGTTVRAEIPISSDGPKGSSKTSRKAALTKEE